MDPPMLFRRIAHLNGFFVYASTCMSAMEICRTAVICFIVVFTFPAPVKATVTIESPSLGNVALLQRNLTLKCTVSPVQYAVSWLTPGTSGTTCICETNGTCRTITQDRRYSCSSSPNGVFTMLLTSVAAKDEGEYMCRHATYPNTEDRLLIVVQDSVPISGVEVISPTTSPVTVTENVSSTFVCETSSGRPQAAIQWYKRLGNGSAVTIPGGSISILPNGSLVITRSTMHYTPTRGDNDYMIYCTAYNIDPASEFTSTNQPKLFVQYAPDSPAIIEGHADKDTLYILDGQQQTLTCSIQGGRPRATLAWSCFNGTTQNKSIADTVSREITWTATRAQDGQRCSCESSHPIWKSTRNVHVIVEALYPPTLPTVTVQEQYVSGSINVIKARNVTARCSSSGNPPPSYAWASRGSSTSDDSTLELTDVQDRNQGDYTCTATNTMVPSQGNPENGTNNVTVSLNMLYPPSTPALTIQGQIVSGTVSVVKGRDVTVRCNSTGNPSPQYKWVPRGSSTFTDTLTLTNVKTSDQGNYICTVFNMMIPTQGSPENGTSNATVFLNVLYAPERPAEVEDHTNGSTFYILDSKPQTLTCSIQGGNPLPTLAWRCFNGTVQNKSSGDTVSSEITWTASTRHDGQGCICESSHALWSSARQIVVIVEALYPPPTPTLTVDGKAVPGDVSAIEGRNLTVSCNSSSNPPPSYTWDHQGTSTSSGLLTLTNVTNLDQGDYTCTATNAMLPSQGNPKNGTSSVKFGLTVLYPPSKPTLNIGTHTVSGQISIIENRSVTVLCSCYGSPPPGYTWEPRGSSTSNDSTLTLVDIQSSHQGDYTCTATNTMVPSQGSAEEGTSNATLFVNVLYPPRHVMLRYNAISGPEVFKTLRVVKGDSFTIYCRAEANPLPTYHWTGQAANYTGLSVTYIQADQSWTCTVTNQMISTKLGNDPITNVIDAEGYVTVNFDAEVLYEPSVPSLSYHNSTNSTSHIVSGLLSIIEGTSFNVVCDGADGRPVPSYSWSGHFSSQTGTLTVDNIDPGDDNSSTTCTASNIMNRTHGVTEIGTNATVLNIRVLYAPRVTPLADDKSIESDEFSKTCIYTPGNPATTTVWWTKPDGTDISGPHLTISNVTRKNDGEYTCTARNTMTPTFESAEDGYSSQTFQLSVYYSASIKTFTFNGESGEGPFTYDENSTIAVRCEIDSNPESVIVLFRDDAVLETFQNARIATHAVRNTTCLDAGDYVCVAQNDYNNGSIPRITRQILIRCPPRPFDTVNNLTYYVGLNDSVTLHLSFTAYPVPDTYKWYKYHSESNWTTITEGTSSTGQDAYLKLTQIQHAVYGQYMVVIVNSMGILEHLFFISARGKPETPIDIIVQPQHNYVVVQWTPSFNGGLSQTFYIEYRKETDLQWTVIDAGDETTQVFNRTVGEIVPNTDYIIRMYAQNAVDKSDVSEEVQFKTLAMPDSPASSPVPLAAIVGGVVAAVVVIVVAIVVVVVRRRRNLQKDCGTDTQPTCRIRNGPRNERRNEHVYEELNFDRAPSQNEETTSGHSQEIGQTPTQTSRNIDMNAEVNAAVSSQRSGYEEVNPHTQSDDGYEEILDTSSKVDAARCVQGSGYEEVKTPPAPKYGGYEDLRQTNSRGTSTKSEDRPHIQTGGNVPVSGNEGSYIAMEHSPKQKAIDVQELLSNRVNATGSGQGLLRSGYEVMHMPTTKQTDDGYDVSRPSRDKVADAPKTQTNSAVQTEASQLEKSPSPSEQPSQQTSQQISKRTSQEPFKQPTNRTDQHPSQQPPQQTAQQTSLQTFQQTSKKHQCQLEQTSHQPSQQTPKQPSEQPSQKPSQQAAQQTSQQPSQQLSQQSLKQTSQQIQQTSQQIQQTPQQPAQQPSQQPSQAEKIPLQEIATCTCMESDSWSGYESIKRRHPGQDDDGYEKLSSHQRAIRSQDSQKYVNLQLKA